MASNIDFEKIKRDLEDYMFNYYDDIKDIVIETTNEIAKQAIAELKQKSPRGRRRKYYKGWTKKTSRKSSRYIVKIHNKTDYKLTHLLEYGHATVNGKRTRAFPHIKPVEAKYVTLFEKELSNRIRRN